MIRECIYIRMHHLDLNVNGGRHHLPLIWDNLIGVYCVFGSHDAMGTSVQTIDKGIVTFPKALCEFSFAIHHDKQY